MAGHENGREYSVAPEPLENAAQTPGYQPPEKMYTLAEAISIIDSRPVPGVAEEMNERRADWGAQASAKGQFIKTAERLLTSRDEFDARDSAADIADSLRSWWLDVASQEVEPLIAKMFEYGGVGRSSDLVEIGKKMVRLGVTRQKSFGPNDDHTSYAELGIYFYIEGKMARWSAAIAEGRPVSDDTLLDIGIYVRMVQRIRTVGGWPV